MARGRKRIRRETEPGRPSIFFIIALAIGILFLLWFFIAELRHPVNEQKRGSLVYFSARYEKGNDVHDRVPRRRLRDGGGHQRNVQESQVS